MIFDSVAFEIPREERAYLAECLGFRHCVYGHVSTTVTRVFKCLSVLRCAERRVAGLRKQIEELRSALDAANAELEDAKLCRETAEQELKGYEVELAVNESAIQTLEVLH